MKEWLNAFLLRLRTKNLIKKGMWRWFELTNLESLSTTLCCLARGIWCRKGAAGYIFNMNRNFFSNFFWPFFSNSRSIISATDLRISVPMTFMRSLGLRQSFYRKRKLIFFGPFFSNFAGPLSQQWTWGFRFRWHLWGPRLRQFFYRKENFFFLDHFFQFAVHYLSNGPEDFGSDDIYEVPRP